MALVDNEDHATLATTAKLVGSRAFFEHKHVEEGGLPDTSEPDFMLSESFETEEMHLSEPLLSLSVPLISRHLRHLYHLLLTRKLPRDDT